MSLKDKTDAQLVDFIAEQEARIQFNAFPISLAHDIGQALTARALEEAAPVVIDITRTGQCLFHCTLDGATPDNAEWVLRKNRVVNRFRHSSLYMGAFCRAGGFTLEEKFFVPESTHAPHGGAFPITVQNTGVIGTVTVSGLPQLDDHALVTAVLEEFL